MTYAPEHSLSLDFDEAARDPRLAAAIEDASARVELVNELVQMRKRKGLTQTDVASEMETTQSFVSDFENGRTDPHLSTFQRYARAVATKLIVVAETPLEASLTRWDQPQAMHPAASMTMSPRPVRRQGDDQSHWAQLAKRTDFALGA